MARIVSQPTVSATVHGSSTAASASPHRNRDGSRWSRVTVHLLLARHLEQQRTDELDLPRPGHHRLLPCPLDGKTIAVVVAVQWPPPIQLTRTHRTKRTRTRAHTLHIGTPTPNPFTQPGPHPATPDTSRPRTNARHRPEKTRTLWGRKEKRVFGGGRTRHPAPHTAQASAPLPHTVRDDARAVGFSATDVGGRNFASGWMSDPTTKIVRPALEALSCCVATSDTAPG